MTTFLGNLVFFSQNPAKSVLSLLTIANDDA